MRTFLFSLLFLSFGAIVLGGSPPGEVTGNDSYWISFTRYFNHGNDSAKFLMQIDSTGRVLKQPWVVITEKQLGMKFYSGTSLSPRIKGNINFWIDAVDGINKYIYRLVIDPSNQKLIRMFPEISGKYEANNHVELLAGVTQKESRNFVEVTRINNGAPMPNGYVIDSHHLQIYSLSRSGALSGSVSEVSLLSGFFLCGMGISSDGRTTFWLESDDAPEHFYLELLDDSGTPFGGYLRLETDDMSCGADVSNTIMGSEKFVVYKYNKPANPGKLVLRIVNSETAQPLGDEIVLRTVAGTVGDIAIDPLGRFVIFSQKPRNRAGSMVFQALDATGHASGPPKVLMKKLAFGLDLLREN